MGGFFWGIGLTLAVLAATHQIPHVVAYIIGQICAFIAWIGRSPIRQFSGVASNVAAMEIERQIENARCVNDDKKDK